MQETIEQYIETKLKQLYKAADTLTAFGVQPLPKKGVWHRALVLVSVDGGVTVCLEEHSPEVLHNPHQYQPSHSYGDDTMMGFVVADSQTTDYLSLEEAELWSVDLIIGG